MGTVDDRQAQRQSSDGPITIIGGAGFIGKRLTTQLLDEGHVVRVVDVVSPGSDVDYREADVRDPQALAWAMAGSRMVYNLAAVHRDDVKRASLYHEVNVDGASNVTAVCRALRINKLVFSSSVAVYGLAGVDISEDKVPSPANEYGRSKLRAEQEYRDWHSEAPDHRSLVIVRPCVVFGASNRGNVYRLLRQLIARRFVMVGNGKNRKSLAYVDNLSAFLACVQRLNSGLHLYNYADKPDLSMNELVSIMSCELGRPANFQLRVPYTIGYLGGLACDLISYTTRRRLPITALRIRKFCTTTTFATQRVSSTGFKQPVCLHDALKTTIKYELSANPLDTL